MPSTLSAHPLLTIHPLPTDSFAAWYPLWQGYQRFYDVTIPDAVTAETWRRFHDSDEAIYGLGAFQDQKLVGIVHFLFHRSTWTLSDYCYLQDLFTIEEARGQGVGRRLIEAVYEQADKAGADRVYWTTQENNMTAQALYDTLAQRTDFIQYKKQSSKI